LDGSRCHLVWRQARGLGHIVLDGLLKKGRGTAAPHFSAHVYCGQTVAHLSIC